jgi:hypothetical protein
MKKMIKIIVTMVLALSINGCDLTSKELIDLRNEIRYLETEISSIRAAPGFLFGEAFEYIDAKEYNEAVNLLKELHTEFPEWNSAIVEKFLSEYSNLVTPEEDVEPE